MLKRARIVASGVIGLALFGLAHGAGANGRYPKADQLVIAPDDSEFLVARSTFGILVSHDSGQNWDWICERAIGYSGVQDPTIGLMAGSAIIAGLSEGIARSTDRGCNWAFSTADLGGAPVIDLSVHRNAPNHALALVWDAQNVGYSSRLLATNDNGRSFSPYGNPLDRAVLVTTIDSAPSNAQRVYASGTRATDGVRSALLFASDDAGEHWSEYPVPFDPKLEQGIYIAAVDPEDADTLYLRTSSATVSRLLVSHDGGKQIDSVYTGSLLSFALSPDGKQLYFGGEDGLHAGLASDLKFEKRSPLRMLCLAASAQTLYACSDEYSGFTVGASLDGGLTFEPLLHLKTVRGPLACSAARCEDDWPLVRAQLGIPVAGPSDAGAGSMASDAAGASSSSAGAGMGEAGAPSAPSTAAAKRASCAAALASVSCGSAFALLPALALFSLSLRRRSRARSRLLAK